MLGSRSSQRRPNAVSIDTWLRGLTGHRAAERWLLVGGAISAPQAKIHLPKMLATEKIHLTTEHSYLSPCYLRQRIGSTLHLKSITTLACITNLLSGRPFGVLGLSVRKTAWPCEWRFS